MRACFRVPTSHKRVHVSQPSALEEWRLSNAGLDDKPSAAPELPLSCLVLWGSLPRNSLVQASLECRPTVSAFPELLLPKSTPDSGRGKRPAIDDNFLSCDDSHGNGGVSRHPEISTRLFMLDAIYKQAGLETWLLAL